MRHITLLLLILMSGLARAEVYHFAVPGTGTLRVSLIDRGPIYEKFIMEIMVLCEDQRRVRNVISPTWETVIPKETVCYFNPRPPFNRQTGEATLTFGKSKFGPGQASCDEGWQQTFNVRQLCSAWRN